MSDEQLISIGMTIESPLEVGDTIRGVVHSYHPNPEYDESLVYTAPVFTSSDEAIATVIADPANKDYCIVTGVAAGAVVITATIGEISTNSVVIVAQPLLGYTNVELSIASSLLLTGDTSPITVNITGDNVPVKIVPTRDSEITIDGNSVTGSREGIMSIKAIGHNVTSNELFIDVRSRPALLEYSIDFPDYLVVGSIKNATVYNPKYSFEWNLNLVEEETAIWSSSNPAVATVSESGEVEAISSGYFYVQCSIDGSIQSKKVTVP